jgi:hypothetical protein
MKAKLLKDTMAAQSAGADERLIMIDGVKHFPAGTIIDHPRAYRLVQMGTAEPADPECTLAAGMSSEAQQRAQLHQAMVAAGIHPDDYQKYLDGQMIGYDAVGKLIPGPNYVPEEEEEEEDDDSDE